MLRKLISKFDEIEDLPVEVDQIVAAINEMGLQDEIYLFEADTDPTKIIGAFKQFTYHKGVYAEPTLVTHIIYSSKVPLEWQRVICVKELVHIFDSAVSKTDTEEEVSQLLDKLIGPLSSEDYGIADLQATTDRLALYQSLPLLLPKAALISARNAVESGSATLDDVAEWACMPAVLVGLMLGEHWKTINGAMEDL